MWVLPAEPRFPLAFPSGSWATFPMCGTVPYKRACFLVPNIKVKAFSYLLFSILAEGLLYMASIMLKYFYSIPIILSVLIINGCFIFVKWFFAPLVRSYDFYPFLFKVMSHLALLRWYELHLIMRYYIFLILSDSTH